MGPHDVSGVSYLIYTVEDLLARVLGAVQEIQQTPRCNGASVPENESQILYVQ